MIEYRDVQAAQARIASHIIRTPLLRVPALDEALGCQVYLKHEGFQAIGAFKIRGALNKALSLSEEELGRGLVCASSGNHAQGVAYAAQAAGVKATVVMPAVSVRKIRLPSVTGRMPASCASWISSGAKPPSGPIKIPTVLPEKPWTNWRMPLSSSFS